MYVTDNVLYILIETAMTKTLIQPKAKWSIEGEEFLLTNERMVVYWREMDSCTVNP